MKNITSDQNSTLRKAIRLHESRGRRQQQRIIIFGENEIGLARNSGLSVSEVFVCDQRITESIQELVENLEADGALVLNLTESLFRKLSFGDRYDGIVATASRPDKSLSTIIPGPDSLIVVLEAIEKPGNIGAVFRSADAAGVDAVLMADVLCDAFHPNTIRASLGTVFSMPWATDTSHAILDYLKQHQFRIVAAKVDGQQNYFDEDLSAATAMILGNEHVGLGPVWNAESIVDIRIPMQGRADSLNISASASVLIFEAQRQRMMKQRK